MAPAQAFGLFALSGRVTAFIGPAAIAAVTAATGSQRLGISPVILLFLDGTRAAILGENGQRAVRDPRRMIRRLLATALALGRPRVAGRGADRRRAVRAPRARPRRTRPTRSASRRAAASPARRRCPRPARPGRRCGSSRNHNWGNPVTIDFIEDLSRAATGLGWRGLYVGDISQPRGGPVKGHASHQTGLDIDIWYTPADRASTSAAPSASGSGR